MTAAHYTLIDGYVELVGNYYFGRGTVPIYLYDRAANSIHLQATTGSEPEAPFLVEQLGTWKLHFLGY